MEYQIEVGSLDRGMTALEVVSAHLEEFLDHFLTKLFLDGQVQCGPHVVRADQILPPGVSLTVLVPEGLAPNIAPKPYPLEFLMEDDRILAVEKPSGLAMLPGLGFEQVTLFEAVWHHLKGSGDRPRIVNRIDRGTSGIVLFARDKEAQAALSGQFQRREVSKLYRALVVGCFEADEGEIDLPLSPHSSRPEMMVVDRREGKDARTSWRVVRRFGHFTELELIPLTGRTHQIRVHLKAIDHPLAFDPVYGPSQPLMLSAFKRGYRQKDGPEHPLMARTPLHAARLAFRHPADQRPIELVSPFPKDIAVCFKQLAKWDPPTGSAQVSGVLKRGVSTACFGSGSSSIDRGGGPGQRPRT